LYPLPCAKGYKAVVTLTKKKEKKKMGKFSRAFKDAKAAFKISMVSYKNEKMYKHNLDTILDAYAIMPDYMRGGTLKKYILNEIKIFETVYCTKYSRKDEVEKIGQPEPYEPEEFVDSACCEDMTLMFADDGSITVAEEYHE
jgi:hypothetical protein